jgi:hypothetical protein
MRHGLMLWKPEETAQATLEKRIADMRVEMGAAGFDALLFYTNMVRPAAVTYLTAFTPYWADAVLLLLRDGPPVFVTALSKRVSNWIRSTNPLSEIVNSPKPGMIAGERLRADASIRRVGVLEYDMLPFGVFDDLTTSAPGVEFADASEMFALVRTLIDPDESVMLGKADALARAALSQDYGGIGKAGDLLGKIEHHLRNAGAEEAYLAIVPDLAKETAFIRDPGAMPLGSRFAVSVSLAFKGSWVRRTRCLAADPGMARTISMCEGWWHEAAGRIKPHAGISRQLDAMVKELPDTQLHSWTVEACRGSYPLQLIGSSLHGDDFTPLPGRMLVLSLVMTVEGAPWFTASPFITGEGGLIEFTGAEVAERQHAVAGG